MNSQTCFGTVWSKIIVSDDETLLRFFIERRINGMASKGESFPYKNLKQHYLRELREFEEKSQGKLSRGVRLLHHTFDVA